jgi:hypothetical protein
MTWILTTVLCIVLIEFVVRIPLSAVALEIISVSRKALHIMGAKSVSDHWKEKVMLAYAGSLFKSTMKLAGFLVTFGAIALLLIFVFDFFGSSIGEFIVTWIGILFSVVVATVYITIRKYFV